MIKFRFFFIIAAFLFIHIFFFSCRHEDIVEEYNPEYYLLMDVLKEMNISTDEFIELAYKSDNNFTIPVNDMGKVDHAAEALVSIYFSKNTVLSTEQAVIFNKYYPQNNEESIYKIISEIVKARFESDVQEDPRSLIDFSNKIYNITKIKLLNQNITGDSPWQILNKDTREYYNKYLGTKIDYLVSKEAGILRKKLTTFTKTDEERIKKGLKKFYSTADESTKEIFIIIGSGIKMISYRERPDHTYPYIPVWKSFTKIITELSGEKYAESLENKIDKLIKKDGMKILNKLMELRNQNNF